MAAAKDSIRTFIKLVASSFLNYSCISLSIPFHKGSSDDDSVLTLWNSATLWLRASWSSISSCINWHLKIPQQICGGLHKTRGLCKRELEFSFIATKSQLGEVLWSLGHKEPLLSPSLFIGPFRLHPTLPDPAITLRIVQCHRYSSSHKDGSQPAASTPRPSPKP